MPPGRRHLRGPADPHHPPQPAVADVHAEEGRGARAADPRALRRGLDPLVGIRAVRLRRATSARQMPMRVIGMLLGIPEAGPGGDPRPRRRQPPHRGRASRWKPRRTSRTARCSPSTSTGGPTHPSDDIMTDLLNAEFEDETGTTRRLTPRRAAHLHHRRRRRRQRDHHPAHRLDRQGARRPPRPAPRARRGPRRSSRPPSRSCCASSRRHRTSAATSPRDAEFHGRDGAGRQRHPAPRRRGQPRRARFDDADRFDIHRPVGRTSTFGYGAHFCLGAALARLEGRIALDELLKRFPEWDVDLEGARLSPTSTVRGWETLPLVIPG